MYQLAKLRMLEFYYDFLDKYVDRLNFEYCYMDTGSVYFAIDKSRSLLRTKFEITKICRVKMWL